MTGAAPTIDAVLGEGGLLSRAAVFGAGGYRPRPAQLAMAHAVARALDEERPLCVEAGTGTGKTLAYLVPAILSGRRVVVSTGTRTLQEQIARKDLPLLAQILPAPFEAAVLKGLSNYVCRRRLNEAVVARIGGPTDPAFDAVLRWVEETDSGDRAELESLPEEAPVWAEVLSSPETRIGPRCPEYERCFATRARQRAARAQIIVVNHHLFFADLALRDRFAGAQILPEYDAIIFDEAHQLEEIATQFFGVNVSARRVRLLGRDARRVLDEMAGDPRGRALADHLDARTDELFRQLASRLAREERSGGPGGRVVVPHDLFDDTRRDAWLGLDTALEELGTHATRGATDAEEKDPTAGVLLAETLSALARRAGALRDDLAVLADRSARAVVYWAEGHDHRRSNAAATPSWGPLAGEGPDHRRSNAAATPSWGPLAGESHDHRRSNAAATPSWGPLAGERPEADELRLSATPIDVGPLLRERLFDAHGAIVLTSATLAPGGDFAYFRERLGLDRPDVGEAVLASPFDYAKNALLYVARDLPDPAAAEFPAAAATRVLELLALSRGRAFVLFTSYRNLHLVSSALRGSIEHRFYVQGEAPRATLLDRFRREPGVLCATSSFWEGVDVPGEALSLVVIDRLPFGVPDDPLHRARCERLEEQGVDPFARYQIPRAALALRQGFGRLIRTETDRGVVAVLDRRLMTRGYGRAFLEALPPARRSVEIADVARFFAT
jgi:ATP-dependent DNA helicase DinG